MVLERVDEMILYLVAGFGWLVLLVSVALLVCCTAVLVLVTLGKID